MDDFLSFQLCVVCNQLPRYANFKQILSTKSEAKKGLNGPTHGVCLLIILLQAKRLQSSQVSIQYDVSSFWKTSLNIKRSVAIKLSCPVIYSVTHFRWLKRRVILLNKFCLKIHLLDICYEFADTNKRKKIIMIRD